VRASIDLVNQVLGSADILEDHMDDISGLLTSRSKHRPVILLLASSVLVTDAVALVQATFGDSVPLVTLGVDAQEGHCNEMLAQAYAQQTPIIIEGAHRSQLWVQTVLDPLISKMAQDDSLVSSNFRLILLAPTTAADSAGLSSDPLSLPRVQQRPQHHVEGLSTDIMRQSSKIMFVHPRDFCTDFLYNVRALTYFCDVEFDGIARPAESSHHDTSARTEMLQPLLFSLSMLHVAMRSSLLSGAIKSNERLEFGIADLTSGLCMALLLWGQEHYNDTEHFSSASLLPWATFRTVISQTSLGALIVDPWERRLFDLQLTNALPWRPDPEETDKVNFARISALASQPMAFEEMAASVTSLWGHKGVMPSNLSGVHDSALEQMDALHLQRVLGELRFVRRKREINRQDKAKMTADDILERLPSMPKVSFAVDADMQMSPFYQVYMREIVSISRLLQTMSTSLHQLECALVGQTRISTDLEVLIDAFCHDTVPAQWSRVAYPSCRSLGGWFNDVIQRCDVLYDWCNSGMMPPVVWLPGLFHPEAFVTAIALHQSLTNRWPLAETVLHTEVLEHYADEFVDDEAVGPGPVISLLSLMMFH
jgi:hypothetical protein